ncbi:glycoside hydrolase family 43 protein [Lapidilactobacillus wuchangensis]|uniref:glycoside hydrolase family 43 protein n=1 Tax=Lapidilactobacillus wuchangensis TaxID=2486001 RepID=UPI000F7A8A4B|nr:family 43 glycosylhydrolase [Lapidilactobacillus wuchangensis]
MQEAEQKQPIVLQRADPWVYYHTDGYYYFTGSVPGYQEIEVRRARHLSELENGERVSVWQAPATGIMSRLIWAPEIHYLNGKWYIYFAAADDESVRNAQHHHRMFVIECSETSPMTTNWQVKGQIKTPQDSFSLDATVFEFKNELYYLWAQQAPAIPGNSNLYLAKMSNPWTLATAPTLLSIPEHSWEKIGFKVNEGAAVLIRNHRVLITYSGSATDENYAMGLLWADADSNLLDAYSWHKIDHPVFKSSPKNHLFGPGHNSFTTTPDGQTDILVYHARPYDNHGITGDSLANPDRHAYAQAFTWDDQGFPVFGEPGDN